MTLEQFLQNLQELQEAILSVPFTDNSEEYLNQRHQELSKLLEFLSQLEPHDQIEAKKAVQELASRLSERLTELKGRLSLLQENVGVAQMRVRGMKAYNQGKIF